MLEQKSYGFIQNSVPNLILFLKKLMPGLGQDHAAAAGRGCSAVYSLRHSPVRPWSDLDVIPGGEQQNRCFNAAGVSAHLLQGVVDLMRPALRFSSQNGFGILL